ncbi:MAG: TlpA disulfide reductase family protein [Acidobacteriota bacterium]
MSVGTLRLRALSLGLCVSTWAAWTGLLADEGEPAKAELEPPQVASLADSATAEASDSLVPVPIDPPAANGSTFPALASENVTTLRRKHDVLMTWLEPGEADGRLKFARYTGQEWTPPVTITDGVSSLAAADPPSLIVLNTQAVRRTLIARTGNVVARSGNAGRTWSRLPAPPLPFASFAGGEEGGYAFWLAPDGDGSARLLGTRILAGEALLDPRAADGAGTSAAMTWDGPVVVYRDGSTDGAQDINLIRRQDARWTRPRPVHHVAGWRQTARPKSGPEVAALKRQVAVAWYTETPHRPRILAAFSSDAGQSFGAPAEVDVKRGDRVPLDFVDVTLNEDGHALVLWMASNGPAKTDLKLARVTADGGRGEELILAKLPNGSGGLPQITRVGDSVAVAWSEEASRQAGEQHLRVVSVPLAGIPTPGSGSASAIAAVARDASGSNREQGSNSEPLFDTDLLSLDGDEVSLLALRGRAVLLNLWATWCLPCIAEMPELAVLHERHRSEGLEVVGLSVDDASAEDRVRAFVAQHELPFAIWLDPEMHIYDALRVKSLPVTLVIDRQGGIVWRRDEAIKADDPALRAAIRRVLSDP